MNDQVRVLLVTTSCPPARGEVPSLLDGLVRHATRATYRVVALGDACASTVDVGVATRSVRSRGPRAARVAALGAATLREARGWRPDAVLCADGALFPAARCGGRPVVQVVCSQAVALAPRMIAYAVRHAAASILLGSHARTLALSRGADERRVHVVAPGIDPGAPPTTSACDRAPLIVHVGGLDDRRAGADVLLRALPLIRGRVPDATLTLVGDGHLRAPLRALARANGCEDAVSIADDVAGVERSALLGAATVFAVPGHPDGPRGGGSGRFYAEAGARATPVVAGAIGDALDCVVDGVTGLLVEPGDHIEVAEAIVGLLLDRERAARLGAAGRRRAERRPWGSVVGDVEEILLTASRQAR